MKTSDIEPQGDGRQDGPPLSKRKALSNLRRELSEDESDTPAVQRMLLDEVDRLEAEVGELRQFRDRFYSADKNAEVLRERLRASVARDGSLAIGAAILGLAPSLWSSQPIGWIVITLGLTLVVAAVAARRFRS